MQKFDGFLPLHANNSRPILSLVGYSFRLVGHLIPTFPAEFFACRIKLHIGMKTGHDFANWRDAIGLQYSGVPAETCKYSLISHL